MAALHIISRIEDDPKNLLVVQKFTSNPKNRISSNFSELHETLKFIDQQKKESIDAKQKISSLTKEAVKATEAGLLQDAINLRNKITKLIPIAYAINLTM